MRLQDNINFQRIEEAIGYIRANFKKQPGLDEVAEHVHLSPYHFQRMFSEWAGVSPKKFLQHISTSYAKKLLKDNKATLSEASHEIGLSGTSRLHDLFINIEGMTPAEYKYGGKNLNISYSFADSLFGEIIVASTSKGICYLAFSENKAHSLNELKNQFPNAEFDQHLDMFQQNALFIFTHDWSKLSEIKLHLKGTDFQLKVWETLIKIPEGSLTNYGQIAHSINKPNASRAVGTAIGNNPVAYLIPCHRVIQSNGNIGEYHWGSNRKTAMIGWEAVRSN
ncbi:bifunctional helix-turn-helix domain-containing protein/methylated-DNA--[protein]-cysteine S-methyltransferase [Reichenbachiella sp.]|uniref:bifunctional helix-turn-helix domain-containing protein/methylated-DNA--[protein]-cysteine S-methyltransferase n=1 Tax=Reichenbachiella sp. TaxID=2184521 RepID=UPI003BAF4C61